MSPYRSGALFRPPACRQSPPSYWSRFQVQYRPSPSSTLLTFSPEKERIPSWLSHSVTLGQSVEQMHNLSVVLLGHRIGTSLLAHASCRSQPFSWGMLSQGLVGKKNLHPIWHTGGNELVACVCYKFLARHSHERIITYQEFKYLPHCFSPFCYGGGP